MAHDTGVLDAVAAQRGHPSHVLGLPPMQQTPLSWLSPLDTDRMPGHFMAAVLKMSAPELVMPLMTPWAAPRFWRTAKAVICVSDRIETMLVVMGVM